MENWRITSASVTGTSHTDSGTECQDRLEWKIIEATEGPVLVAVIADGAGSTSDGERGAEIACRSFIENIGSYLQLQDSNVGLLNPEFGTAWISFFQSSIEGIAAEEEKEVREFSSTFIGAVVGLDSAAFYQVGDGGLLYTSDPDAQLFEFGIKPVETEYVNMTNFLTDEDAVSHLRYASVAEKVEDLILFSDGISNIAIDFSDGKPFKPFLDPMIAPLRNGGFTEGLDQKLESFLDSEAINKKTDDDKSIILASRISK